jgi:hypothetical protein
MPQLTYREGPPSSGSTRSTDQENWSALANQLRRESVERAQLQLGYPLIEAVPNIDDQLRYGQRGQQQTEFSAAQKQIQEQIERLGARIAASPTNGSLLASNLCLEVPATPDEVRTVLVHSSDGIARLQQYRMHRTAAVADAVSRLTRSQALATPAEALLAEFGYGEHVAQAGVFGIALRDAGVCGRAGPFEGPPLYSDDWVPLADYPPEPQKDPKKDPKKDPDPLDDPDPPKPLSDPCADALTAAGVDPAAAAVKRTADEMTEAAYEDAALDLIPGDFSHRQLNLAASEFASAAAFSGTAIELADAATKLTEASQARRKVVDSVLFTAEETFADLLFTASQNPGLVPIHPLLTEDDTAAAVRLMTTLRDPMIRSKIDAAGKALDAGATNGHILAFDSLRTLTGATLAENLGALPLAIRGDNVALAQQLVTRIRATAPLIDRLEHLRPAAEKVASPTAVVAIASQVLFSEIVGKDALLAARQVRFPQPNAVVAFEGGDAGLQRLIALAKSPDLLEVEPAIRLNDVPRLELHRRRIELAKTFAGEATIAAVKSIHAPVITRAEAAIEVAAAKVTKIAQHAVDPAMRAIAAELPILARTRSFLQARIGAADAGAVHGNASARQAAVEDLSAVAKQFNENVARLRKLALLGPSLDAELDGFGKAADTFSQSLRTLANNPALARGAREEIEQLRPQRLEALRSLAHDAGFSPSGPFAAALASTPALASSVSDSPPATSLPTPELFRGSPARDAYLQRLGEGTAFLANQLPSTSAYGGIHRQEDLNNPDYLAGQMRARTAGWGWAHQFKDEKELQQFAQERVQGLGAVHFRSDLEDPAYMQRLLKERLGGLGWTHTFKDDEELQNLVQGRLGQFGMAHKRSDLQDPAYFEKLFKERVGGFGWAHTFKDLDEMKAFVQSRLGGYGNAVTCLDLQERGVPPALASAMMQDIASRSKRAWETEAQYEARMLKDRADLFYRDGQGALRQRTWQQQQQARRDKMLATGYWIEDPRSGNIVRRDSKAGQQELDRMLDAKPRTIRVRLADGGWLETAVGGFSSLQDALDEALSAKGLRRDSHGDWIDDEGHVLLTRESAARYDQQYTQAMDRRAPGFSQLLTHRRPEERPGIPPVPVAQQFRELEDQLRDGFGYNIREFSLGDSTIDLEVRPGESVTAALHRVVANDRRFYFDTSGDLIDRRTGKPARSAKELAEIDGSYRNRVVKAVFGEDYGRISREALFLAEHGSPEQRSQAQMILAQLKQQFGQLTTVTDAQHDVLAQIGALAKDASLTPSQRMARERALRSQLDQLAEQRADLETAIVSGARGANTSAQRVVQNQLSYTERQALAGADKVRSLADEIDRIKSALLGDTSPTEDRNLKRRLAETERELYRASQYLRGKAADLSPGSAVADLARPLHLASYGITGATAADAREARNRAVGVRFTNVADRAVGYYVQADGTPFRDPNTNVIYVSEREGKGFERGQINDLARNLDDFHRDHVSRSNKLVQIGRLQEQLEEAKTSATRRQLERKIAAANRQAEVLADRIDEFARRYNALASDDRRETVLTGAAALAIESQAAKQALQNGASTIQVLDENGKWVTYESPQMRKFREEREARLKEAGVHDPKMLADARDAARPPPETLAADPAAEEAARKRREQQQMLGSDYQTQLIGLREMENKVTSAEQRLREARAAAFGKDDSALQQTVREAESALTSARADLDRLRAAAADAAAVAGANDPELVGRLTTLANDAAKYRDTALALDKTADALRAQLAAVASTLPAGTIDALRNQLAGVETARNHAAYEAMSNSGLLALARDNAAFADATPDYNASRLGELMRRVESASRPAEEVLSKMELEELQRRGALAEYFTGVSNAHDHLKRLAELTERERLDPKSLSGADKRELERGLGDAEMRTLLGETQRRGLLELAKQLNDPQEAESWRSLVSQWMTDPNGGRNGTSVLVAPDAGDFARQLGFLDRSEIFQSARAEAARRVESRRAELDAARADFRLNPTTANAESIRILQDLVHSGQRLLADADRNLLRATNSAPATRVPSAFATTETGEPYRDRIMREQAEAAQKARAEEARRLARYDDANKRFKEGVTVINEIQKQHDEAGSKLQQDYMLRERVIGKLRGEYYALQKRLEEESLNAEDRAQIEKLRSDLNTLIDVRQVGLNATDFKIRQNEIERMRKMDAVVRTVPPVWERDPAVKAAEERARHEELFRANQEIFEVRAGHAAKLAQFDERMAGFQRERDAAKAAGNTALADQLQNAFYDAQRQRYEFEVIFKRSEKTADQMRWEMLARNRADRIGPADDYDLNKFLTGLGVDPAKAYQISPANEALWRNSGNRAVDAAVANNVSAADPSLARLFAQEAGANILDYATSMPWERWQTDTKGAAYGLAGAAEGAWELVKGGVTLTYYAGRTAVEAEAVGIDSLAEIIAGRDLGLTDAVGTSSLDSINSGIATFRRTSLPDAVHTATRVFNHVVDETLKDLSKGDVEAKSARLGGRIAFEIGIGFVNPESVVTTIGRFGEWTAPLIAGERGAAAFAAFESKAASAFSKASEAVAGSRAALNQSALGRTVNQTWLGREVLALSESVSELVNLNSSQVSEARRATTTLEKADFLVARAATAPPDEAAKLLKEARAMREAILTQLGTKENAQIAAHIGAHRDLAAVERSVLDSARTEAATLARGVRTTPEGLANSQRAIEAVRKGEVYGPVDPLAHVRSIVEPKGLSPEAASVLAKAEADAMAKFRVMTEARASKLETELATRRTVGPDIRDQQVALLREQAATFQRDETVLRALAEPGSAQRRAAAIQAIGTTPISAESPQIAGADAAAKSVEKIVNWVEARGRSPELGSLQRLVAEGKAPHTELVMDLKADPRAMRSLKNAPEPVRTAFNDVEEAVNRTHDQAIVDALKKLETTDQRLAPYRAGGIHSDGSQPRPVPWAGKEIKVHDFRTPGAPPGSVNTDRDYRVIYKVADTPDGKDQWIEIPRKHWEEFSHEKFAEVSGYSPEKVRALAAVEDEAAWKSWDSAKNGGRSLDQAMKEKWAELHQQLATDKYHPEASTEFSDQFRNAAGQLVQADINILKVKKGEATLLDGQRLGMMYNEKADAFLRLKSARYPEGDKLEGLAQINKAVEMLDAVRAGYRAQGLKVGELADRVGDASALVKKLAPFDHSVAPEKITELEQKIRALGFGAAERNAIAGLKDALDGQFHSLNLVAETRKSRGIAADLGGSPASPRPGPALLDDPIIDLPPSYSPKPWTGATPQNRPPAIPGRGVAYARLPQSDTVAPGGFNYVDSAGHVHELDNFIGEGSFSSVYGLARPEDANKVIKFRVRSDSDFGVSASDMVASSKVASERLAGAGIPQVKVIAAQTQTEVPYLIVEKLPSGSQTFAYNAVKTAEDRAAVGFTKNHERAVVKLHEDLADNGLVAQDLKVDNLYFFEKDGKVVAGVLDHDRILPWEQAKESYWFKAMIDDPLGAGHEMRSFMFEEVAFKDPHHFMAKMLEAKGWVDNPSLFKAGYKGQRLGLDVLKGSKFESHILPKALPGELPPEGMLGSLAGIPPNRALLDTETPNSVSASRPGNLRPTIEAPRKPTPAAGSAGRGTERLEAVDFGTAQVKTPRPTIELPRLNLEDPANVKRVDEALGTWFGKYKGDWQKVREAQAAGRLKPEQMQALESVRAHVAEQLRLEANAIRASERLPARHASVEQIAYWDEHPGFRNEVVNGAVAMIRAAAKNNSTAKAFIGRLDSGDLRLNLDPRLNSLGLNRRDGVLHANPFVDFKPLTDRPRLRTIDDIAGSLLHEFVHDMGYNEVRAWYEQYRFLSRFGRQGSTKYDTAIKFAQEFGQDRVRAITQLSDFLRQNYKQRYSEDVLTEAVKWDRNTFGPIIDKPASRTRPPSTQPTASARARGGVAQRIEQTPQGDPLADSRPQGLSRSWVDDVDPSAATQVKGSTSTPLPPPAVSRSIEPVVWDFRGRPLSKSQIPADPAEPGGPDRAFVVDNTVYVVRGGKVEQFSHVNRTLDQQVKSEYLTWADSDRLSVKELQGKTVLDLAAGTDGQMVQDLRKLGIEAYGVDIALSERAAQSSFLKRSDLVTSVPFQQTFDVAYELFGALSYGKLDPDLAHLAFMNAYSRVKPGGTLYLGPLDETARKALTPAIRALEERGGRVVASDLRLDAKGNPVDDNKMWRIILPP